ncbi:uncharacterized protein LOC110115217 [Dendrobium catenatum]|uniref:uncharacterized protein LOC110115217 n=1 Tax=Dendrobium catenatum TaxID=906689 RepID=UPI0009F73AB1|nr:uncharacterized protein LOC110115217 [Dendrobium catenatum]
MHYYIYGTSPKEYNDLNSDVESSEFIKVSNNNLRAEIVITVHESMSNLREFINSEMVESSFDYNDCISSVPGLCYKDIAVGTYFSDVISFKHTLRSVAIKENFGVRIKASDKKRVIATCSYQSCQWRIRASLCEDAQTFEVRRVDGVHTCPGINRAGNRLATSAWVAKEIQEMVKRNPDVPPKDINSNLEKEYGLSLPYMKLWRSREQARESIFGSVDDNYKWVPSLHVELIGRNPGSHITYMFDQHDNSFQRFYVSFKVCTDEFMYGCRPLISLDACHLKSKHLGMLLSATSLDGNNGLFPLAFAVVETESKQTWFLFLQNLGESIGTHIVPLAFISDMEKGLGEAIKDVYPAAEHRICIRHLWKNIKKKIHCKDGHKLQGLVWGASNAYTTTEYNDKLVELSVSYPTVYAYLISLPYKWSRSQFMYGIYHGTNTNNFAESFNAWIMEARNKPVVDLIDMIRGKLMEQRATRMKEHPLWHTYNHEYFYVHRYTNSKIFRYRMAYDGAIGMLPGKDQWQVIHDAVEIGVPNTSRPRGRPKRRRLPNFLEKDKKKKLTEFVSIPVNSFLFGEFEFVAQISVSKRFGSQNSGFTEFGLCSTRFTDFFHRIRVSQNLIQEFGSRIRISVISVQYSVHRFPRFAV